MEKELKIIPTIGYEIDLQKSTKTMMYITTLKSN